MEGWNGQLGDTLVYLALTVWALMYRCNITRLCLLYNHHCSKVKSLVKIGQNILEFLSLYIKKFFIYLNALREKERKTSDPDAIY